MKWFKILNYLRMLLNVLSSLKVINFGLKEGDKEWLAINDDMGKLKMSKNDDGSDNVSEYDASKAERIQRWFRIVRMVLNKKYPDQKYLSAILNFIHALISMKYKVEDIKQT